MARPDSVTVPVRVELELDADALTDLAAELAAIESRLRSILTIAQGLAETLRSAREAAAGVARDARTITDQRAQAGA